MRDPLPDAMDDELRTVSQALTTPLPVECVLCFVWRMLAAFGCNATLRWARHWRDARAPRATALERRLSRVGGFCDCEIFLNGWAPAQAPRWDAEAVPLRLATAGLCAGVRAGSAQPCARWVRQPRG